MVKRRLPQGFDTWLEMYDSIVVQNPHLLSQATITYCFNTSTDIDVEHNVFKIRVKTLLANCFLELVDMRLTQKETNNIFRHFHNFVNTNPDVFDDNGNAMTKVYELLSHLSI